MEQTDFFGEGSFDHLFEIFNELNPKKTFLIAGGSVFRNEVVSSKLEALFCSRQVCRYTGFPSVPTVETVKDALGLFLEHKCDLIVAIGGGTAIDIAKLVSYFSDGLEEVDRYFAGGKSAPTSYIPIIAVPTTAGSGSEATKFAVIYKDKIKYSIEAQGILPRYAIVDPVLTYSMPKGLAAACGFDALCQAIESYWSVSSTTASKAYAAEAIELVQNNFVQAVNNPNADCRAAMCKAAHLAGKAINISKTTSCHAFSYPLTARYGLAHGHAVALTLAEVIKHNSEVDKHRVVDSRGKDYVQQTMGEIVRMLGATDPGQAAQNIQNMLDNVGLEKRLSSVGMRLIEEISIVIKEGFNPDRIKNNPLEISEADLKTILENIF